MLVSESVIWWINKRKETYSDKNPDGRFRRFIYAQIKERDKTSLDIFWIKDKSLADLDNLPDPDVLAGEIIDNLETAMESFKEILAELGGLNIAYLNSFFE